ncbi:MAG: hypothetical protein ABI837_16580 [Acidobacteriota bacterium]
MKSEIAGAGSGASPSAGDSFITHSLTSIRPSPPPTLHSSLFTLHHSLFTLHHSLFTLY